ncbi:uncharacterized protein PAE49_020221 isoform 1-T2 [Odontesthes bonariensis]
MANFIYTGQVPMHVPKSVSVCATHFRGMLPQLGTVQGRFCPTPEVEAWISAKPCGPSATHTDQVHSSLASTSSAHVQTSRTRDAACQTDPIVNRTAATPKNVVFLYIGMLCRLYLAAIHFNENANRPQAQTADGVPLFKISFPKSKKGECSQTSKD